LLPLGSSFFLTSFISDPCGNKNVNKATVVITLSISIPIFIFPSYNNNEKLLCQDFAANLSSKIGQFNSVLQNRARIFNNFELSDAFATNNVTYINFKFKSLPTQMPSFSIIGIKSSYSFFSLSNIIIVGVFVALFFVAVTACISFRLWRYVYFVKKKMERNVQLTDEVMNRSRN
jgi:hypothetical protein